MVRHVLRVQTVQQLQSRGYDRARSAVKGTCSAGRASSARKQKGSREARAQRPRFSRSRPAAMRHLREKPCDAILAKTAGSGRIRRRQTDAHQAQTRSRYQRGFLFTAPQQLPFERGANKAHVTITEEGRKEVGLQLHPSARTRG